MLEILSNEIFLAGAVAMAALGGIFAVTLAVAGKYLAVDEDPRVEKIEELLPGANCGACGYAGCSAYAKAIVHGSGDVNLCPAGGSGVAAKIAEIMGVEVEEKIPNYAVVQCQGCNSASEDRCEYNGVEDCLAAELAGGGPKSCLQGCLGFGNCARACPFDAIRMQDGLPVIIEEKCVACGACVDACPRDIVKILPAYNCVHVKCLNTDKGAKARKICKFACIGCKKCEKVCKFDAVHVKNFVAVFDYDKCVSCGACVKECPQSCITNVRLERKNRGVKVVKPKKKKTEPEKSKPVGSPGTADQPAPAEGAGE